MSDEQVRRVESRLIQIAEVADEELQQLVLDTVLKYGQAMDTTDWRVAFLTFWQILEAISLCPPDARKTEMTSRVMTLNGWDDSLHRDLLSAFRESRSRLVHQGRFSEDGLGRVNLLKSTVESTLSSLLCRIQSFPSKQALRAFYGYASMGTTTLESRREVITTILRTRGVRDATDRAHSQ